MPGFVGRRRKGWVGPVGGRAVGWREGSVRGEVCATRATRAWAEVSMLREDRAGWHVGGREGGGWEGAGVMKWTGWPMPNQVRDQAGLGGVV